jgi:hypothetical protein
MAGSKLAHGQAHRFAPPNSYFLLPRSGDAAARLLSMDRGGLSWEKVEDGHGHLAKGGHVGGGLSVCRFGQVICGALHTHMQYSAYKYGHSCLARKPQQGRTGRLSFVVDVRRRRPAWEIGRGLKIQTLASTVSMEGDRTHPVFKALLQGSS